MFILVLGTSMISSNKRYMDPSVLLDNNSTYNTCKFCIDVDVT